MEVKIKLNGGIMPMRQHEDDAAFDLFVPLNIDLQPGRQVVDLKFSLELPRGYAATIQPRSGFSAKGMEVYCSMTELDGRRTEGTERLNADVVRGLIDAGYRGSVGVIVNVSCHFIGRRTLMQGTRIAQMQIVPVPVVTLKEVDELSETDRGEGGFGSSGAK
jgi:dUTP pyrophosphatase